MEIAPLNGMILSVSSTLFLRSEGGKRILPKSGLKIPDQLQGQGNLKIIA
jgi:hypothetical protein